MPRVVFLFSLSSQTLPLGCFNLPNVRFLGCSFLFNSVLRQWALVLGFLRGFCLYPRLFFPILKVVRLAVGFSKFPFLGLSFFEGC